MHGRGFFQGKDWHVVPEQETNMQSSPVIFLVRRWYLAEETAFIIKTPEAIHRKDQNARHVSLGAEYISYIKEITVNACGK